MELTSNKSTYRQFLFFWSGQMVSLFGSSVAYFVLIWWLTIVSGNPMILAVASFFTILLSTIIMPIAGVWADRFNRKTLIIIADLSQALVTLVGTILFQFNLMVVVTVLIFMTIRSLFQAFHAPIVGAITPSMVPLDKLLRINSLSFLFLGVIQIFAQLVASIFWLLFPIHIILWVDIITFAISLIPLIIIKIPSVKKKSTNTKGEKPKKSFLKEFIVGLKTLKAIPGLLIIVIMSMIVAFLMAPLKVLMSLYVYDVHGGDAGHFALVLGFFQGGIVLGAIIASIKKKWEHKVRALFILMALAMVGLAIFAIAPKGLYLVISIGAILTGVTLPITSSLTSVFYQTTVPLDKMGRVSSISGTISASILPIGTLLSGPLALALGIPLLFFYSSELSIIVIASIWILTNIRKVDFDDIEENKKIINEKLNNIEA